MATTASRLATGVCQLMPPGDAGLGKVATSTWGIQAFRLATLAVLVNFLPPAEFGFFAFAQAIFTIAQPIAGLGLPGAMVVAPRLGRPDVTTALVLSLASGPVVAAVLGAGLVMLQRLNPQMDEFDILFWMAPGLVLTTITNTAPAIPRREQRFGSLSAAMLAGEGVGSALAIFLAFQGYGLASLTVRYVATAGTMAIAGLWILRRQVLGLAALLQFALAIPLVALTGMGHTRAKLRIDVVATIITLIAIACGSPFGIDGLLAALLPATLASLPYQYIVLRKWLGHRVDGIARALLLPLAANSVLAVVLVVLVLPLSERIGPVLAGLLAAAIAGLVPIAVHRLRRSVV